MTTPNNTAAILKSLADETRLSMVRKLASGNVEVNGADIVSDCSIALKLSQPTMSHHFQKLVSSGVLTERKVGVEKFYKLDQELLTSIGIDAKKL